MISKVRLIEQGGNQCIDIQNTCWNKGGGRGAGGGGIITAKSKITSCGKSNNLWEAKTLTTKNKKYQRFI